MYILSSQKNPKISINQAGFTLVELLVVLSIAAVFASIAVPDFSSSVIRSNLRISEAALAQTLRQAKSIARSRSSNVTVTAVAGNNFVTLASADGTFVKADGTAVTITFPDDVTAVASASFTFTPLGTVTGGTGNIVLRSTRDATLFKTITVVNTMGQITSSSSY